VILIIFNGRGTITKVGDKYKNTLRVLQLWGSACWAYIENYQCGILIHREPVRWAAEDSEKNNARLF